MALVIQARPASRLVYFYSTNFRSGFSTTMGVSTKTLLNEGKDNELSNTQSLIVKECITP